MNIKHVEICDFRRSELTNCVGIIHKHPRLGGLGKKDVIMLVNLTHTQVVMVMGFFTTDVYGLTQTRYLHSEKLRMLNGEKWNPWRIRDYARRMGVTITNFHLIEAALTPMKTEVEELKIEWRRAA